MTVHDVAVDGRIDNDALERLLHVTLARASRPAVADDLEDARRASSLQVFRVGQVYLVGGAW